MARKLAPLHEDLPAGLEDPHNMVASFAEQVICDLRGWGESTEEAVCLL